MDDYGYFYIASYIVSLGLVVSGLVMSIPEKKCDLSNTYHVHLYTKQIEDFTIEKYLNNENGSFLYTKNPNLMKATDFDLKIYDELAKKDLFDGRNNHEYLNYQIRNNRDYLEFYYHYTTTTSNGKTTTVHTHSGWSESSTHHGVTGLIRVVHKRYYSYKIIYSDDKEITLLRSNEVDDIREIINEYPYMNENTNETVYDEQRYKVRELKDLKVEDISPFYTPSIESTNSISLTKKK